MNVVNVQIGEGYRHALEKNFMSTPKGVSCFNYHLDNGDQVLLYIEAHHVLLQLRRKVPTEQDILAPSFKVAVSLAPHEAQGLAEELQNAADHAVHKQ